ncbi:MAG: sodium:proton antiporter NhaD [Pseudomonadota bacterium]|nr:sodium:proton antiporter NhaD [Pseudomonadota bacterium]
MNEHAVLDLTATSIGLAALLVFAGAYTLVIFEEWIRLKKSKPVLVAAGIIWALVALAYGSAGEGNAVANLFRHDLLSFSELMLFLLVAITFINTMENRLMFDALRDWLVGWRLSYRMIYWLLGILSFFISAVADNLTTALFMGTVASTIGEDKPLFRIRVYINIVVAANAGGAWSPFGDITTLMVWQAGILPFERFFDLLLPSLVNWSVPAFCLSFIAWPEEAGGVPEAATRVTEIKKGGLIVMVLFLLTIAMSVCGQKYFSLPPVWGMMLGFGLLGFLGKFLGDVEQRNHAGPQKPDDMLEEHWEYVRETFKPKHKPFDFFVSVKKTEWDTLFFFFGVIMAVGGLGAFGYLTFLAAYSYGVIGPTLSNIGVGVLSSVIDNIPIMFAILTMHPEMDSTQWLLVTLTAGVGGSLLSIGSAAGVGLMGQARGVYTFFAHLKWTWAIALGYVASIWVHLLINT